MKLKGLALLAILGTATGCVSSGRYDDLKQREQELSWRVEVSERATLKSESEKKLAQRETDLAREDARVLREKLALANEAMRDAKREVDEELKARIAELQAKAPTKQELSPYGGVVLESGILFAPGRHELTKAGETALGPLVDSLASAKYDGFQIELSGHTDSDPLRATAKTYMDNHDLAAKRANSVRRYLLAHGVPGARVYLSAWGETRPLATEASAAGKSANRRVEIRLHHEGGAAEAPTFAPRPEETDTKPASAPRDAATTTSAGSPPEAPAAPARPAEPMAEDGE